MALDTNLTGTAAIVGAVTVDTTFAVGAYTDTVVPCTVLAERIAVNTIAALALFTSAAALTFAVYAALTVSASAFACAILARFTLGFQTVLYAHTILKGLTVAASLLANSIFADLICLALIHTYAVLTALTSTAWRVSLAS